MTIVRTIVHLFKIDYCNLMSYIMLYKKLYCRWSRRSSYYNVHLECKLHLRSKHGTLSLSLDLILNVLLHLCLAISLFNPIHLYFRH